MIKLKPVVAAMPIVHVDMKATGVLGGARVIMNASKESPLPSLNLTDAKLVEQWQGSPINPRWNRANLGRSQFENFKPIGQQLVMTFGVRERANPVMPGSTLEIISLTSHPNARFPKPKYDRETGLQLAPAAHVYRHPVTISGAAATVTERLGDLEAFGIAPGHSLVMREVSASGKVSPLTRFTLEAGSGFDVEPFNPHSGIAVDEPSSKGPVPAVRPDGFEFRLYEEGSSLRIRRGVGPDTIVQVTNLNTGTVDEAVVPTSGRLTLPLSGQALDTREVRLTKPGAPEIPASLIRP